MRQDGKRNLAVSCIFRCRSHVSPPPRTRQRSFSSWPTTSVGTTFSATGPDSDAAWNERSVVNHPELVQPAARLAFCMAFVMLVRLSLYLSLSP